MDKSTKTLLTIIGILSILAGAALYFKKQDTSNSYLGILTGVSLLFVVFTTKKK